MRFTLAILWITLLLHSTFHPVPRFGSNPPRAINAR